MRRGRMKDETISLTISGYRYLQGYRLSFCSFLLQKNFLLYIKKIDTTATKCIPKTLKTGMCVKL